ncbi:Pxt1 [Phodopus roborovskii]|uniref:Pxt1 protein n=1 Tax=Phodopus roborovskii TaxID=109678 RepID=A0AAU9ZB86_PHORO|nr:Pxt1 [Phodopus roborovskii]
METQRGPVSKDKIKPQIKAYVQRKVGDSSRSRGILMSPEGLHFLQEARDELAPFLVLEFLRGHVLLRFFWN